MLIGGFQKMTLLDFPGRIACILFTHGCNFRCPYCHNAPLVTGGYEGIDEAEILAFLKKRHGILDGVCISGGEPLLQKDLPSLMYKIKQLGYDIKLDTNGSFPQALDEVITSGLCDYVAMDIKNSREKYKLTVNADVDMASIERSAEILLSGRVDYEFRTTVTRELHTEDDMRRIGEWIRGARKYFLQGFIDSGDLVGAGMSAYFPEEMKRMCEVLREYVPNVSLR